ncbi:CinA family protein [Notoacmeibacter sp. MSK16QG-6]|uniref:CinA family protein n=1 Tax=Notoacmeibacter sp. MSK16QG-6 TaxID=2957982 RepID=UPI00209D0091|nr:CinA family protein [Notoacmeibacter sp. MSK16QG-6]MCP1200762.1 CinA family protein [Notoacmeibacter sp. MSK16QG-6]
MSEDTAELVGEILKLAEHRRLMIGTAESCTGGMVASALTSVPGSSSVVDRAFVTYSNAAKMDMLGVDPLTLRRCGAVSGETAREMAVGAKRRSVARLVVSTTGIAGPDGGTEEKPVGLVCFGLAAPGGIVRSEQCVFDDEGREAIRKAATKHALEMILGALKAR